MAQPVFGALLDAKRPDFGFREKHVAFCGNHVREQLPLHLTFEIHRFDVQDRCDDAWIVREQRIAIARAILKSPQILVLDEATSNLDSESEQLIQSSMADLLAGRMTFVIAHRLSTVRRADLILLIEDGRVTERGTHEQLMRNRNGYSEMVQRQVESNRDGDTQCATLERIDSPPIS